MKRHHEVLIREYLSYFPCVVIVGARQTGKTTLMSMISSTEVAKREFFDLEARADYDQVSRDPDLFLRINQGPMAIDEAQLIPELFPALRVAIDRQRSQYGQYLLSSSSSPTLLKAISESLAGRVGIVEISPFSFAETRKIVAPKLLTLFEPGASLETIETNRLNASLNEVHKFWFHGGYPEPWLRDDPRFSELWREQYLKTYIERDIARLFPHLNPVRFRRFIEILAACSGTIINYSNIAKILDVSQPTVKDYFRIAHGTFIWRNLPAYTKSVSKRVVKHPKGYFRDSGMMHHLTKILSVKQLLSHPQMGASWEATVIEEILRALDASGTSYTAYYYRTSGGAEVDLVIEGNFGLIPFEIKYTQTVNRKHLRVLRDFVNEFHCPFGVVINNDEKFRRYEEKIVGIPFAQLA